MFGCLVLQRGSADSLLRLAERYSPHYERVDDRTLLIPVYGLERLMGSLGEIAEDIAAEARRMSLDIALGIASHPDTAILAARNIEGITLIEPGDELEILGPLPADMLPATPDLLDTLKRWGIETLTEFAHLPPLGVIERLGEEGGRLQALVEGRGSRPLRISRPPEDYTAAAHLDDPLSNSEPLLFLINGMMQDIVKRLAGHGLAVGGIKATLTPFHEIRIQFPAPVQEAHTILKQVQLDLEKNKPKRAITAVAVELQPTLPRSTQHGLFTPPAPEPAQLQTLLARLRALTGENSAGSPELLNTHRPDAWRLRQDVLFAAGKPADRAETPARLSFRRFRPALAARVDVNGQHRPARVQARGAGGLVVALAGPWRSTGEWWTDTAWARDEWDAGLDDGALYRIYRDHQSNNWFIEGVYD